MKLNITQYTYYKCQKIKLIIFPNSKERILKIKSCCEALSRFK